MPRRRRHDRPGAEFHVMNRGIARRTIYDTPADYRFFLACLVRAVRRGEIEVLAYCLMRTHFHLFLRSLGGLSTAMRRVQLRHVRRFNRLHRRDGPLLRSRFLSKRVPSRAYGRNVVHYTHENPVLARLCEHPSEYPWSSAWLCSQPRVPLWFSTKAIEWYGIDARSRLPLPSERVMLARAEFVDARLRARATDDDLPLDGATPARVLDWMRRKSRLADGYVSTLPRCGPMALRTILDQFLAPTAGAVTPVPGAGTYATRDLLLAGMLRDLSCCSSTQIAATLGQSVSRVKRLRRLHRKCLFDLPVYAEVAAQIASACLALLDDE